jgi:mitofilin
MLRHTLSSVAKRQVSRRNYAAATSAKKRALQKSQLAGSDSGSSQKAAATAPPPPPPPAASNTESSSSMIPIALVGLAAAGGAAYYLDLFSSFRANDDAALVESTTTPEGVVIVKEETAPKESAPTETVSKNDATETSEKAPATTETAAEPSKSGSRVTTVQVPPAQKRAAPAAPKAHPVNGNRVTMAPPASKEASVVHAVKELEAASLEKTSQTLLKARQVLRAELDQSVLTELDSLTPEQLKVRIVQLATEMEERTKWEAVRLQEFLAMKEKETGEKYMEILQKQRLEFEALLASRLREQEDALTRQANAALQSKENGIQSLLQANAEAQEAEHKADLESLEARLNAELAAKYETAYNDQLAQAKTQFVQELEEKTNTIAQLAEKLKNMEAAFAGFKSFEVGSVQAHKLSSAALAFSEKLETDKPAGRELQLLKNAAGDNEVIVSAVSTVPASIVKGIPTLSELQTRFETVYKKSRQAALVPDGRATLGGQLLGMVFSTVKYAPEPDDAAPADAADENEYILVRARKLVQLGELERAIEQLEKLKGQPAFTSRDWTLDAKDRVAAEKAAKVIKMECAIVNDSFANDATV